MLSKVVLLFVVKPACEDCPDFITQRKRKQIQMQSLSDRKRSRAKKKASIKQQVRKRRKLNSKVIKAEAAKCRADKFHIPALKSTDDNEVERWIGQNQSFFIRFQDRNFLMMRIPGSSKF